MLAKLAVRNVRRSARDYAVYFVTLLFGVAVFYAFNSIESQAVLFDIKDHTVGRMLEMTNYLLGLFSVAVALVLAFLVAYANRFIIKRRKREFGTYLLLGMSAPKMATVLLVEMLAVGVVSLAIGLVAGLLLSQGLAFATAALMGTTMTHYTFVVSGEALLLTLACFAVMFAATLVMNVVFVSRRKLGDLLTARSEVSREPRLPLWARAVGFAVALGLLAASYWMLWQNQFEQFDAQFGICTALMVAGTVLLFWSGSTIVLALVQGAKGFYLKGLHAFTSRQISSKIGTAFASLSVVCIMLFFALSTVSIGFGVRALFVGDVEACTQYDATMVGYLGVPADSFYYAESDQREDTNENRLAMLREAYPERLAAAEAAGFDMAGAIAARNPEWSDLVRASAQLDYYQEPGVKWGDVLARAGIDGSSLDSETFMASGVTLMSLSQFNAVRALTGKPALQLADGRYFVNNTLQFSEEVARLMRDKAAPLSVAGIDLVAAPDKVADEVRTGAMADVGLELVVPDAVTDALRAQGVLPVYSWLDCMYSCERTEGDERLAKVLDDAYAPGTAGVSSAEIELSTGVGVPLLDEQWPYANIYTGAEMAAQAGGLKLLITYLALYIGFVLFVSTAAILAIQQLSETADSVGRYQRLFSLGCDKGMVLGSLRTQSVLYFLAPLAVALVHSAYAVHVMNAGLFSAFGIDPMSGIAITGGLVVVVYGCYLLVTYLASRRVVCDACGF